MNIDLLNSGLKKICGIYQKQIVQNLHTRLSVNNRMKLLFLLQKSKLLDKYGEFNAMKIIDFVFPK